MQPPISKDQSPEKVAARLRVMFEMHEEGTRMLRLQLQRRYPDESPAQISARVAAFLRADHDGDTSTAQSAICPHTSPAS